MNKIPLKIFTLIALIIMVVVNYLAVFLPLAGRDTGAISDGYANLFAPAGYAFSIWGVIYILLALYVFYQFSRQDEELAARVNRLFIINAFLNAGWIFSWHYDVIWLSVLIMLGLLFTLIKISDILRLGAKTAQEQWLMRLPFGVYFGWITVATIANITTWLVSFGWNGFGWPEVFWTVAVLLVGAVIGSWRALLDRSIPYAAVLIWAYGAILAKHLSPENFAGKYPAVITVTGICMAIFAGIILYLALKRKPAFKQG